MLENIGIAVASFITGGLVTFVVMRHVLPRREPEGHEDDELLQNVATATVWYAVGEKHRDGGLPTITDEKPAKRSDPVTVGLFQDCYPANPYAAGPPATCTSDEPPATESRPT